MPISTIARRAFIVGASLALAVCLTACGGSEKKSEESAQPSQQPAQQTQPAPVTPTAWSTGDTALDEKIKAVCEENDNDLTKCCAWAQKNITYVGDTGRSDMTKTSEFTEERIMQEARAGLIDGSGNCFTLTSAGYCFAKYLDIDAQATVGIYTTDAGKDSSFCWLTTQENGQTLIYDVTRFSQVSNSQPLKPGDQRYDAFKPVA